MDTFEKNNDFGEFIDNNNIEQQKVNITSKNEKKLELDDPFAEIL